MSSMFIQINDWNNLTNSGVASEEPAALWAQLWGGPPSTACLQAVDFPANPTSSSIFSTTRSQGCRAKALPIPHSLTLSQTPSVPSLTTLPPPIPPLGQSLFPSLFGHMEPLTFPGKPPATSEPKQDVPRLHFRFVPKGPNSLPAGGTESCAASRVLFVSISMVLSLLFCHYLLVLLLELSSLQSA